MPQSHPSSPEKILADVFGHEQFRNDQAEVVQEILQGNHCLVIMPTGMGKSLCYQIPALVLASRHSSDRDHNRDHKAPLTLVHRR